jgi:hypothetical protein
MRERLLLAHEKQCQKISMGLMRTTMDVSGIYMNRSQPVKQISQYIVAPGSLNPNI